jgi:hypothetical protein
MTSLQPGGLTEVTITPRGRTSATLEGRWDDIYVTLINIKNDGRLVPYAQAPVDIADGRVRVEVFLRPAEFSVPAATKTPRKTRKLPRLSPIAWVRIRWALVAAVGTGAAVGGVLGAIALVEAVAALVAMWALPALVLLVLVSGIGIALGKGYQTAPQHVEPDVHPPGFVAPTVRAAKPPTPATELRRHHWLTGKELKQPVPQTDPIEDPEDRAEVQAEAADVRAERYYWWGGLKPEHRQTDDLTSRWLARMRDPNSEQSIGRWQGVHTDPSLATFEQDIHSEAKCAVSWLLQEVDPKGWKPKDNRGDRHGSWYTVNDKYGKRLIKDVIDMNDRGVRLNKIADYVERKTGE